MSLNIHPIDLAIVAGYVLAMIAFGVWIGRGQQGIRTYLLGDKNLPWFVVLLSVVATETSTVTFLSIPGKAFEGDLGFLQLPIGYLIGRYLVAAWLLPQYFRGELFTAYEVLGRRFGPAVQRAASLIFLVARTLGDGLRLFLAAIVLKAIVFAPANIPPGAWDHQIATGVLLMGVTTIIYTFCGGIKAVAWADFIQFFVYVGGALLAAGVLLARLPGGWWKLTAFAQEHDKFRIFHLDLDVTQPYTLWAGIIGGIFISLGTHGADQLMVQRYLAARSQAQATRALTVSGWVVLAQFALFLLLGAGLACFYQGTQPGHSDGVFIKFIVEELPVGAVGLVIAAVLAAAMSSSLNSSAAAAVNDFYLPLAGRDVPPAHVLGVTRGLTILFGILQMAVGAVGQFLTRNVIDGVMSIAGFTLGIVLGLFFLATFSRRADGRAALVAMAVGAALMSYIAFGTEVAWPWYAVIGSLSTCLAGVLFSLGRRAAQALAALLAIVSAVWAGAASAGEPGLPLADPQTRQAFEPAAERIAQAVAAAIERGQMPGAVVLIAQHGRIVHRQAYGDRAVEPAPIPMSVDSLFDLASLTKPVVTASCAMKLVEQGRLDLERPVAELLPDFGQNGKQEITAAQLLTHTAGLTPDNALSDYGDGNEKSWQRICELKLDSPPGSTFAYSDVGYIVLGKLIERVSEQPLDEFARASFFEPLRMRTAGFRPPEELRRRAAPTEKRDGEWLQGKVHDPRAHALGGVAGHAGLFATADDLARFAQMLLGKGSLEAHRALEPETVALFTAPRKTPGGPRTYGWDMQTGYSSNRGENFSAAAFGHGGFTGVTLWIDPHAELIVIFLSSRLHPDGKGSVNALAGRIGALALAGLISPQPPPTQIGRVRLGVDVLADDGFRVLAGRRVGLITNHTGVNSQGVSTADVLIAAPDVRLVALFSPEHGLEGKLDISKILDGRDATRDLPIFSLYGEARRPTAESLKGIDTLVFDIQDIGARFYTYISTMGEALEAAAEHKLRFVVLDRPNPIDGLDVAGPLIDAGRESFVAWHNLPVRHGMTAGELALLFRAERNLDVDLLVVPVQGWRREDYWDATGLTWRNPSPNMRSLTQALLYPGIGLWESTNLSVGRGTDAPFERVGAPWIDGQRLAAEIARWSPPGVAIVPIEFTPSASKFKDERCGGVNLIVTDRAKFCPVKLGLALAVSLKRLYPDQWKSADCDALLRNQVVLDAIERGATPSEIEALYQADLADFIRRRASVLLY